MPLTSSRPRKHFTISARNFSLHLGRETKIMGILNLTPDSFSGDGLLKNQSRVLTAAKQMVQNGADILDVGGESTRPDAKPVFEKEEIRRIIPTIQSLTRTVKIPVSVDTYKETVARAALDAGAAIVNNIMGTSISVKLLKIIQRYNAAVVLMHMRGTPRTMQTKTRYRHLMKEIISQLQKSIEKCLEIGIKSDKIIIDPGIGFAKSAEGNLEIISRLRELDVLGCPVLIGTSRKSFIGKVLNRDVSKRLSGSLVAMCLSIANGAHIVRVHDVKAAKDAAKMTDAIINRSYTQ